MGEKTIKEEVNANALSDHSGDCGQITTFDNSITALENRMHSEASIGVDSMGSLQQALRGVTAVHWCDSLAEQQLIRGGTAIRSEVICVRRGYSEPGDGGGGIFVWTQDTATEQSNDPKGALIVVPNGFRTGCWKRLYNGPLNVKWFGAKGNGDTNVMSDDTESIQAALDSANAMGGAIYLPNGTYLTTKTLNVKSGSIVSGDGWASMIYFVPQEEIPCMLISVEKGWNCTLIENLSIQTPSPNPTSAIQIDVASATIRNVQIEGCFKGSASLGFKIAGILISEGHMVRIEDCVIVDCYGDGIKFAGNNPSYGIYIGPHNSIRENRGYGINCDTFNAYQSSEVHIFENNIEANNCNFPETKYQITGCIGPGSIRSNHLESVSGRGGPSGALINLGPYCRAVAIENNNFVGPDDYAIIANFGTWPGLLIKGNSFSTGSIANIWLQQVGSCTIEGNGHWGGGTPVKIDSAPGLRMNFQGASTCHQSRYIDQGQDVQLDLMDEIVYVSIGGVTVTLPNPTPLYYTSKQYVVKNLSDSDITITAPVEIDGARSITVGAKQAVTIGSYLEAKKGIILYGILSRTA